MNKNTQEVSDDVFRAVYDSPAALPGRYKWLTSDQDVRKVEELLGMPTKTIGAPLWVSGDRKRCAKCQREINWFNIVSSALHQVHGRKMIARVILGKQKFVNTEAPRRHRRAEVLPVQVPHRQPAQLQMPQLGLRKACAAQGDTADERFAERRLM
jgi:hypothetical protein